jgi:WD40 repeat protein
MPPKGKKGGGKPKPAPKKGKQAAEPSPKKADEAKVVPAPAAVDPDVAGPDSATLQALKAAKDAVALPAADSAAASDAEDEGAGVAAPWVDDDEDELVGPAGARAAMAPAWAMSAIAADDEVDASGKKRGRTQADDEVLEGVRAVLARAEPVVRQTRQQRGLAAPKPEATLLYPKGAVKDIAWHPSGEVLVTSTKSTIETVHCAGSYTERIAVHSIDKSKLSSFAVCPNGESVVALIQNAHVPLQVNLRTGKVKPLHFMDTRTSASYKVSVVGRRVDQFPLLVAFKPHDASRQRFAMPVGSYLHLGSLSDATMSMRLTLPADVEDCVFMGEHQLAVAAANRVLVYDVRQTAKFVRQFQDEGSMKTNRLSYHAGVLSVGSTAGTVNTYVGESSKPAKTFMNLSASVDLLVAGEGSAGPSMVMGSSAQANGFRFVNTGTMTVAASFPEVGMKHGMVQCLAFNPVHPVFSVGEGSRIVNYAC